MKDKLKEALEIRKQLRKWNDCMFYSDYVKNKNVIELEQKLQQLADEHKFEGGCGKYYCFSCEEYTDCEYSFVCGSEEVLTIIGKERGLNLCPDCQAKKKIQEIAKEVLI